MQARLTPSPVLPNHHEPGSLRVAQPWHVYIKSPLPHQIQAIGDLSKALSRYGDDIRSTAVMACGTGKTLVQLWVAELLGSNLAFFEPTLALIAQNLREWRVNARPGTKFLVVCSDKTVVKIGADEPVFAPEDIDACVTSDPNKIAEFIRGSGHRILISTLDSSPLVAKAYETSGVPPFDLLAVDEAHRTATHEFSAWTTVLDPKAIHAKRRLFATATPKIFDEDAAGNVRVYSMDDEKVYGKVDYRLSFGEAIERNLLRDYQVVAAVIKESELGTLERAGLVSGKASREAVGMAALFDGIKRHGLHRVITYHYSVARAQNFAALLPAAASIWNIATRVEGHAIWGAQPSNTRSLILDLLRNSQNDRLTVVSNCKCLTEGVDIPALDGIAFIDPKQDPIGIVQALGRVMRKPPAQAAPIGTVLVPILLKDKQDGLEAIEQSEFRNLSQVMQALRAHDERLEARCLDWASKSDRGVARSWLSISPYNLSAKIIGQLETQVIMAGLGLRKPPLTEGQILKWMDDYSAGHSRWPTAESGLVEGAKGETWRGINTALTLGLRGLPGGSSLSRLLVSSDRKTAKQDLTNEKILQWAEAYFAKHRKWPSTESGPVEGVKGETWIGVNTALEVGNRGLPGGSSLAKLLIAYGRKTVKEDLTEEQILRWAEAYFDKHEKWPSLKSGLIETTKGAYTRTWAGINSALVAGGCGLPGGSSLSRLLVSSDRKTAKQDLTNEKILQWAEAYFAKHRKWPTAESGPVEGVKGETWRSVNSALYEGLRGLSSKTSLHQLFITSGRIAGKKDLTEEKILEWAKAHHMKHGRWPSVMSGPIEGTSEENWTAVNAALRSGVRGLSGKSSLVKLLKNNGLIKLLNTETEVLECAKAYHKRYGRWPDVKSGNIDEAPGDTWASVNCALRVGRRGFPGNSTLYKLLVAHEDGRL